MKNLKILTYNIHKGFGSFGLSYTLNKFKENLLQSEIDICFLQEVVGKKSNLKIGQIENQFEYIADSIWPYFSYGKNASYPKGDHGNAILSKFPITSETNINLTLKNSFEHRGLLHLEVEDPESNLKIHLLNTHLNLISNDRLTQTQNIIEYVKKSIDPSEAIIFCGDFNDWNKKVHNQISSVLHMTEVHEVLGLKLPKTFPSFHPFLPLDRIYCKNIKVLSAQALRSGQWSSISDHIPILAEFQI